MKNIYKINVKTHCADGCWGLPYREAINNNIKMS